MVGNEKKLNPIKFEGPYLIERVQTPHVICRLKNGAKIYLHEGHIKRAYVDAEECLNLSKQTTVNDEIEQLLKLATKKLYKQRKISLQGLTITPLPLAELIYFISQNISRATLDLCAGLGQLAQFYYRPVTCIESNKIAIEEGRKVVPWAQWIEMDITEKHNIKIMFNKFYQYFNRIVCNPPFEKGIFCLKLASLLLEQEKGLAIFILPIDFFVGSKKRQLE